MLRWRYRVPKIARPAASGHMNDCDLENQSCGRAQSSCRRSTTGFSGTATTAASLLETRCNGANSWNHQRFRRNRTTSESSCAINAAAIASPGRKGRLGDSRRFGSITCIILNRQLSRKLFDSNLLAAESHEFVGRQRIFYSRHRLEGYIMSRSIRSALPTRRISPARWIGVVTAGFGVWSFLIWSIWRVSVGLF
jgi:hypothetical protein